MTVFDQNLRIRGAKGSGQNDANTLQSKASARLVELISEGEIVGLVDGAKSIYFDKTPLQNEDGTFNFENVIWDQRFGTPNQDAIPGSKGVEKIFPVETEVKNATGPVARNITDQNVTSVRVIARVNALFSTSKKGEVKASNLSYAIDLRTSGGSWNEVFRRDLSGQKCVSPVQFSDRVVMPPTGAPWSIRVRKITADETEDGKQNGMSFESYVTMVEGLFTYPYSALIMISVDAESIGSSVPSRAYRVKGRIVKVPSNYDPIARTYSGIWNGTFKLAWTSNPAWVFYDLVTNDIYGVGEFVSEASIDKWNLYVIAQYCDQSIPSGFKTAEGVDIMEPRFTFNGVLKDRQEAYFALQSITATWRGMAYWSIGQLFATGDMPSDSVKLVTPANVLDGSFSYSSTSTKARHSVAIVRFNDKDNFYTSTPELVIDDDALKKFGWREKQVDLLGCTSRGMARRYGRWILDVENNETETVTYKAGFDHANMRPGAIIAIADPRKAAARMGGRVVSHVGTTLTVDSDITLTAGQTYKVMLTMDDGAIETVDVVSRLSAGVLQLASAPKQAVPGAIFIVTGTDVRPRLYRVMKVAETDENVFQIDALFHDPTKYDRIENGIAFEPINYTREVFPKPPSALAAIEQTFMVDNTIKSVVTLSWTPPLGVIVDSYQISVQAPESSMQSFGSTVNTSIDIPVSAQGTYIFDIVTKDRKGRYSNSGQISFVVTGVAGLGSMSVATLTNLDDPSSTNFQGQTPGVKWTNSFPASASNSTEIASDSPLYSYNRVRIYDAATSTLLRTENVKGSLYRYSFDFNKADSAKAGFAGPRRSVRFDVAVVDTNDNVSGSATITLTNPVPASSTPTLTARGTTVNVTWPAPSDSDYVGTLVWMETTSGFNPAGATPKFESTTNFCSIVGADNTSYFVKIGHYDAFGKTGMVYSAAVAVATTTDQLDTVAPDVPTGLALSSSLLENGGAALTATWNANGESDLLYYEARIKTSGGNYISFQTSQPRNVWSSGINRATTYLVSVRAVDKSGNASAWSSDVSHTATVDNVAPAVPANFTASAGFDSIWLKWSKNTEADMAYYEIFEGATSATPAAGTAATYRTVAESFIRNGLSSNTATTLYFFVRAVDTSGNKSAWTAAVTGTNVKVPVQAGDLIGNIIASQIDGRGLDVLDPFGNPLFSHTGEVGSGVFITVGGNNISLSAVAANSLVPSISFVGSFSSPPTSASLGSAWKQNAVYLNTTDGKSYVLTGSPLAWVQYLESGTNFTLTIESSNGTVFKVGQGKNTTLIARLFKNGADVTSVTPDSWFRWRRVSVIPQSSPNDDATWNNLYTSGYKQINISVDQVYARATFFCDIISP